MGRIPNKDVKVQFVMTIDRKKFKEGKNELKYWFSYRVSSK